MRETLSVILIAHNEEQAIGPMLEGLLRAYDEEILEIIVVDDASNLSVPANANLFLFYGVFRRRLDTVIARLDITVLFAVANIFLFVGFLLQTLKTGHVGLKFWRRSVTDD